jgi:hypothetical protein
MALATQSGQMGAWNNIVKKAFTFNKKIRNGRPGCVTCDGAPTGFEAAVGTLCWDEHNSNAYICTVKTGTWVKINA